MDPHFVVTPDPDRRLLQIAMTGFWDAATVERLHDALRPVIGRMLDDGVPYGELLTLVDMRGKDVMPQPALERVSQFVRDDSPSRRVALIVDGKVHRLQAKRIAVSQKYAVFEDEAAARAWLGVEG